MQDNQLETLNTELQTEQPEQESLFSCLPAEVVEKLTPAKMRMLTMYLTGLYTQNHIAKIIGVSANTVRVWLMSDEVQTALNIIQEKEFNIIESKLNYINKYNFNIYLLHEPIIFILLSNILNLNPTIVVISNFTLSICISIILAKLYYLIVFKLKELTSLKIV